VNTRTPSPFQVERAFTALLEARAQLLADDPEMAEQDSQLWQDMLQGQADGDPFSVIDRLVGAALDADDMADVAVKRAQEIRERAARLKRRHDRLRATVMDMLQALDIAKLERPTYSAAIRPAPAHVVITDEAALPDAWWRVKREPNKSAIASALKAGERVPGTEWSNQQNSLTIRTS
jgi:hypothetical protein